MLPVRRIGSVSNNLESSDNFTDREETEDFCGYNASPYEFFVARIADAG
jgi:hypothetical protein